MREKGGGSVESPLKRVKGGGCMCECVFVFKEKIVSSIKGSIIKKKKRENIYNARAPIVVFFLLVCPMELFGERASLQSAPLENGCRYLRLSVYARWFFLC